MIAGSWKMNLRGTYTLLMFIPVSLKEKQEATLI